MCVVIYLCLTSDSFPPCGRNSHVTARNTAGDPRDLSCNIRTCHQNQKISADFLPFLFLEWLFIRQRLSCFIRNSTPAYPNLCFYEDRWTVHSRVDSRSLTFFSLLYDWNQGLRESLAKWDHSKWMLRRGSSDAHVGPSGEHLASSIVSQVQFPVF